MASMLKREKQKRKRTNATHADKPSFGKSLISALLVVTLSTMSYSPAIAVPANSSLGTQTTMAAAEGEFSAEAAEAAGAAEADTPASDDPAEAIPEQDPSEQSSDPAEEASEQAEPSQESAASSASAQSSSAAASSSSASASASSASAKAATEKAIQGTVSSVAGGRYTITVKYGDAAAIPDGSTVKITEYVKEPTDPEPSREPLETEAFVSKDYLANRTAVLGKCLGVPQDGCVFFSKFLNVSIVHNGQTVTPQAAVEVSVETTAVDIACADEVELARVVYDEAVAHNAQAVKDGYVASDGKTVKAIGASNITYDEDVSISGKPADSGIVKLRYSTKELGELAVAGVAMPVATVWQDGAVKAQVLGPRSMGVSAYDTQASGLEEGEELLGAYAFSTDPSREFGTMMWVHAITDSGASAAASARSAGPIVAYALQGGAIVGAPTSLGTPNEMLAFKAQDGMALVRETGAQRTAASGAAAAASAKPGFINEDGVLQRRLPASNGGSYLVNVSYGPESGVPQGATLMVRELEGAELQRHQLETIATLGSDQITSMRFLDIAILDEAGKKVDLAKDVHVSITLEDTVVSGDPQIVHFGGVANEVITPEQTIETTGGSQSVNTHTLDFTASSFSVYALVYGETQTVPRMTYRFYVWDDETHMYKDYALTTDKGDTTFTQTIKNGERPLVPQLTSSATQTFAGWYQNHGTPSAPELSDTPYDFDNITITESGAVDLCAKFTDYAYVVFHDQYDSASDAYPVAHTRRGELTGDAGSKSTSVKISDQSTAFRSSDGSAGMAFFGWSYKPIKVPNSPVDDEGNPVSVITPDAEGCISVTDAKAVDLYPVFKPINWLSYYSGPTGSGATYIPPAYYFADDGPTSLKVPVRTDGYTFDGWFTGTQAGDGSISYGARITDKYGALIPGADDGAVFVSLGHLLLRENATLYAKWTENTTADYRIVVWKQKTTDAAGTPEANRTYEYAESETLSGTIGATVTVPESYKTKSYVGYAYSRCDEGAEVKADGSTVLNVYYDMDNYDLSGNPHNLTFEDSVRGAGASSALPITRKNIVYNTALSSYVPANPASGREGYEFTGWYMDRDCTIAANLGSATMPDHDMTVYAGWEKIWYLVQIDPNYGALYSYDSSHQLVGTGSTWFWEDFGGDPIQEYSHARRDYVESSSGSWFYVKHDYDGYYGGNPPDKADRSTYYTQDPGEATDYATFEYAPESYSYAGWYEVAADGSETPYDFNQQVTHNTTLKLHWKKAGTYYLAYDAGEGTIDQNDQDEDIYVAFDKSSYADNSDVVVTRSAMAKSGYTFAGWRVRGDESGFVYAPGQIFTLHADNAVRTGGKDVVYLDAVYLRVGTASITYDANGGTIGNDMDYGHPSATSAPSTVINQDTHTVSNIVNNSNYVLGNGTGVTRDGYTLLGWSDKQVYDPNDSEAHLFDLGGEYGVDTAEPTTLYAVWGARVTYHLNDANAAWVSSEWDAEKYTYDSTAKTYAETVSVDTAVAEPAGIPVLDGKLFLHWSTSHDAGAAAYDFTSKVQGNLNLYAQWATSVTVAGHAVDASAQQPALSDAWFASGQPQTVSVAPANTASNPVALTQPDASVITVPDGYTYAFAAVSSGASSITKNDKANALYYDATAKKVYVDYTDKDDAPLAASEAVYFVYYKAPPSPPDTREVEVHVALAEEGGIVLRDDLRVADASKKTISLQKGKSASLPSALSSADLFTGETDIYAFGAVLCGTDDGTNLHSVQVESMDVASVAYEQVELAYGNDVYELVLKNAAGETLGNLDTSKVYYLYYPMAKIKYVKQGADGSLTDIQGSLDGASAVPNITYGYASVTMNGKEVVQNQAFQMPLTGFLISQNGNADSFAMPPILDDGTSSRYLGYTRIGAGNAGATNISDLGANVSDGLSMRLQVQNNELKCSFDDGATWSPLPLSGTPTIYAIYTERGYDLQVTKTVDTRASGADPIFANASFTVTISSPLITKRSYPAEGATEATVPATPASGSQPGTIVLNATDGMKVKVIGLPKGEYNIIETDNENYILSAKVGPIVGGTPTSVDVQDNSIVPLTLDSEKKVDLSNAPAPLCKIEDGDTEHVFYTLNSALKYVEENIPDHVATIQMLTDYLMPAADVLEVPAGYAITLTTASSYSGSATITRSEELTTSALFNNNGGTLSFDHVTIDGDGIEASAPLIQSSGALTVGRGATLTGGNNTGNGGAINATAGTVEISSSIIAGNKAAAGGAVYYAGGETVDVLGSAKLMGNEALTGNGGAVYATSGTINLSGAASLTGNKALAGNGGAIYADRIVLDAGQGCTLSSNEAKNGGAVYAQEGTITVSKEGDASPSISANKATEGNGGAFYVGSGSISLTGGSVSSNTANNGNGGAIYMDRATVSVSGEAAIATNHAKNGGGVYANNGRVSVSGGSLTGNEALAGGNGGAVYAANGEVSITAGTLSGNTATNGNGGAVYADKGAVNVLGGTLSGNTATNGNGGAVYANKGTVTTFSTDITNNTAVNGAAVFVAQGSANLTDETSITGNTATEGGAVGVGASSVRLRFSGDVEVSGNKLGTADDAPESNVYLNQDVDTVVNAPGLGADANIGIYVPGAFDSNLFKNRGAASARFGSFTNDANLEAFKNDRIPSLKTVIGPNNKTIWGKAIQVEVYYAGSFNQTFPSGQSATGTFVYSNPEYYPPASDNGVSDIASDLYPSFSARLAQIAGSGKMPGFGWAFANGQTHFEDYLTQVNWDSEDAAWAMLKRDGSAVTDVDKVILYYTEPSYVTIENNTPHQLDLSALSVLGRSAVNSNDAAGYGYVVAVNGATQSTLRPITANDLQFGALKSIKLYFPGACGEEYSFTGKFRDDGFTEDIPLRRTGEDSETLSAAVAKADFTRDGTVVTASGASTNIIFGTDKPICKIVTNEIAGVTEDEIAGSVPGETAGQVEYLFTTLNQAVTFVQVHMNKGPATIEMLVDYLMPSDDTVTIPNGSDITFTTAYTGKYQYPVEEEGDRATISRDAGNLSSFFTAGEGSNADTGTTLAFTQIDFDGKALVGSGDGGAIFTRNVKVTIDGASFSNFNAGNGGAVYIDYKTSGTMWNDPARSIFSVSNADFANCHSISTASRQGGGAIWTNAKTLSLSSSTFDNCTAYDQGGAIFHRIDSGYAGGTSLTMTGCEFTNCEANAAGAIESDAQDVTATGCQFAHCKARERNGGALNIYARQSAEPTGDCTVTVTDCTFEDCHSMMKPGTNQSSNGGALRSTAKVTTVTNCTFTNVSADQYGGAIGISNKNATQAFIYGCTITDGSATIDGGGILCRAKEMVIGDYVNGDTVVHTTITGFSASKGKGGGVMHDVNAAGSSATLTNVSIDGCSAANAGGGVYSTAQNFTMTGSAVTNSTASQNGGGVCHVKSSGQACLATAIGGCTISGNKSSANGGGVYSAAGSLTIGDATVDGATVHTTISNCSATQTGGGVAHDNASATLTSLQGCTIENCSSSNGFYGGAGLYSNSHSLAMSDATVRNNTTVGSGGGVCFNSTSALTLVACTIYGNTSGNHGGGVYTRGSVALVNSNITGNKLSTNTVANAAGMWLENERVFTVGAVGAEVDSTTISGNYAASGAASNLRLWETNGNNDTRSVFVNCSLNGEIRVVNAKQRGTQFGSSLTEKPGGLSDTDHVFMSDDNMLYGIIDRTDDTGKRIIWAADPICKITDANGDLLYLKNDGSEPAVFDLLDNATSSANAVSAFGVLKNTKDNLHLYYEDGTPYTISASGYTSFYVKMLVENYTANKWITTNQSNEEWMKIVLTTEERTDREDYPYRGRRGTYSTVTRGVSVPTGSTLITAKVPITLTGITLDGGSLNGLKATVEGCLLRNGDGTGTKDGSRHTTIEVGVNATLQNASTTKSGGAVFSSFGNVVISGGTIRNCHADQNGGGVSFPSMSKENPHRGYFTFTGGSIVGCTAGAKGGGIYHGNGGTLDMSGTITRCEAANGGGVFVDTISNQNTYFNMSGGFITGNSATSHGGGIAVGSNKDRAKLNFSGRPTVSGNSLNGETCNVELDKDSNGIINTNNGGLLNGAHVGVYVPDGSTLYTKHGEEGDPFGTFANGDTTTTLYGFVNDRNGLKGGVKEGQAASDHCIYWIKIFSLEVNKTVDTSANVPAAVISDAQQEDFTFKVTLRGKSSIKNLYAKDVEGEYGDMTFYSNGIDSTTAIFTLKHGEHKTAENLDPGFDYEVVEMTTDGQAKKYLTLPGLSQSGKIGENSSAPEEADRYISRLGFTNLLPVCKITDNNGDVLYRRALDGTHNVPAVYTELSYAFVALDQTLYSGEALTSPSYSSSNGFHIEMLTPDYSLPSSITLTSGKTVTFKTASKSAEKFPFQGAGSAAVVKRGNNTYPTAPMFSALGALTVNTVTLDGMKGSYPSQSNGGIVAVSSGGSLGIETGATLQNSRAAVGGAVYVAPGGTVVMTGGTVRNNETSGNGAGIYVSEGAVLRLSGNPSFGGAGVDSHGDILDTVGNFVDGALIAKTNGGKDYVRARQDIFIAGYENADAVSVIVDGRITSDNGTIWAWAEKTPHIQRGEQFATATAGDPGNLAAFRNAQDDRTTDNNTDTYLYGVSRGNLVVWSGAANYHPVILQKVEKVETEDKTGYVSYAGASFNLHRGTSPDSAIVRDRNGNQLRGLSSQANGTIYVGELAEGIYYLHEGSPQDRWFTITIDENGASCTTL